MFYQFNNFKIRIPFPFIDVYLFRWGKSISSGIHNHAKNGCFLFLLKGSLKEKRYNHNLKYLKKNIYKAPSISFIHNLKGYHEVIPLKHSYSLHFYHPKGHKTKYFNNNNNK